MFGFPFWPGGTSAALGTPRTLPLAAASSPFRITKWLLCHADCHAMARAPPGRLPRHPPGGTNIDYGAYLGLRPGEGVTKHLHQHFRFLGMVVSFGLGDNILKSL